MGLIELLHDGFLSGGLELWFLLALVDFLDNQGRREVHLLSRPLGT